MSFFFKNFYRRFFLKLRGLFRRKGITLKADSDIRLHAPKIFVISEHGISALKKKKNKNTKQVITRERERERGRERVQKYPF